MLAANESVTLARFLRVETANRSSSRQATAVITLPLGVLRPGQSLTVAPGNPEAALNVTVPPEHPLVGLRFTLTPSAAPNFSTEALTLQVNVADLDWTAGHDPTLLRWEEDSGTWVPGACRRPGKELISCCRNGWLTLNVCQLSSFVLVSVNPAAPTPSVNPSDGSCSTASVMDIEAFAILVCHLDLVRVLVRVVLFFPVSVGARLAAAAWMRCLNVRTNVRIIKLQAAAAAPGVALFLADLLCGARTVKSLLAPLLLSYSMVETASDLLFLVFLARQRAMWAEFYIDLAVVVGATRSKLSLCLAPAQAERGRMGGGPQVGSMAGSVICAYGLWQWRVRLATAVAATWFPGNIRNPCEANRKRICFVGVRRKSNTASAPQV